MIGNDDLEKSVMESKSPINLISEEDSGKYYGEYVAVASFNSKKVIAHGENPEGVFRRAHKKVREPVIFFVPDPDVIYIYNVA